MDLSCVKYFRADNVQIFPFPTVHYTGASRVPLACLMVYLELGLLPNYSESTAFYQVIIGGKWREFMWVDLPTVAFTIPTLSTFSP